MCNNFVNMDQLYFYVIVIFLRVRYILEEIEFGFLCYSFNFLK